MADPEIPAEWQAAVDAAYFYLLLDSARQYGLVVGGPQVDVARCAAILAAGEARGYVPTPSALPAPRRKRGRPRGGSS
jgi:hypothetical protein